MNGQQYYVEPEKPRPHPIMILGIIIFVVPFFSNIIKINIPGWLTGVGTVLILIGAGLSVARYMR